MGAEQARGDGKKRTISGETYDPAKPNTEGPGARAMNMEELKLKLERDSQQAAEQVVAAANAAQAAAQEAREVKEAEQPPAPGINQPLYMLVALGVVVFGIVLLSLNGYENSTSTITLGALATTLGGAIAGVTIPQVLKR